MNHGAGTRPTTLQHLGADNLWGEEGTCGELEASGVIRTRGGGGGSGGWLNVPHCEELVTGC